MLSALGVLLLPVGLLDGELADVVVDVLLAEGGALEQPDGVVGRVVVVQGGVGLPPVGDDGLDQLHSSHGCHRNRGVN